MDIMDGEQIRGRVIVKNLDGPTEGEWAWGYEGVNKIGWTLPMANKPEDLWLSRTWMNQ